MRIVGLCGIIDTTAGQPASTQPLWSRGSVDAAATDSNNVNLGRRDRASVLASSSSSSFGIQTTPPDGRPCPLLIWNGRLNSHIHCLLGSRAIHVYWEGRLHGGGRYFSLARRLASKGKGTFLSDPAGNGTRTSHATHMHARTFAYRRSITLLACPSALGPLLPWCLRRWTMWNSSRVETCLVGYCLRGRRGGGA